MKYISLSRMCIGFLSFLGVVVFSPLFANANSGFLITEIMFDPAGTDSNREWVEIYNSGSTAVDISQYDFLTDGVGSTRHSLSATAGSAVGAGGYAVIVQNVDSFKADYPGFAGLIFDSSWTGLTATTGKTLVLLDESGTTQDSTTYDPTTGGSNDGNSLQRTSAGNWIAGAPTPGAENTTTAGTTDTDTITTTSGGGGSGSGGGGVSTTSTITTPKVITQPRMQATISVQKIGSVGISIPFSVTVLGYNGEQKYYGSFHTAFGDGAAYDSRGSEPFEHVYHFPGSYIIQFEYKSNQYDKKPEIISRTKIEITVAGVVISAMNPDGSIELTNNGDRESDLSDWSLQVGGARFQIPSGTILLPDAKMILPVSLTHFVAPISDSQLLLPSGEVFMKYSDSVAKPSPEIVLPVVSYAKTNNTPATASYSSQNKSDEYVPLANISGNALTANVLGSADTEYPEPAKKRSLWPYIIAIVGVVIGSIFALMKFGGISGAKTDEETEASDTKKIADEITILEE